MVSMDTVTVSPKFQVVIPAHVRRERGIRPGDKLAVIVKHGVVHLIPVRPFEESKGLFAGTKISTRDVRDRSDRV